MFSIGDQVVLSIGPDWKYTISLLLCSIVSQTGFLIVMYFVWTIGFYIGLLVCILQIGSFLACALIGPGNPSFKVTRSLINQIKEDPKYW